MNPINHTSTRTGRTLRPSGSRAGRFHASMTGGGRHGLTTKFTSFANKWKCQWKRRGTLDLRRWEVFSTPVRFRSRWGNAADPLLQLRKCRCYLKPKIRKRTLRQIGNFLRPTIAVSLNPELLSGRLCLHNRLFNFIDSFMVAVMLSLKLQASGLVYVQL